MQPTKSSTETSPCNLSVIIVSFNTRDLLRGCLQSLLQECSNLPHSAAVEIMVVDNASRDHSAEMVESEFSNLEPPIRLLKSEVNLGFGGANNLAIQQASGRYIVLLNSDAFLQPGALLRAWESMEKNPATGIAGGRLIGRDGAAQPSARSFHSVWRDACVLTGMAARFPKSRIFAALDRTYSDLNLSADVEWVPGAFMIIRREVLDAIGLFDPRFFLYYEETDLCRRARSAGFRVSYWPDVVVTHYGGESGRQLSSLTQSKVRVELWRMRSTLLYYRKHHGAQSYLAMWLERTLYTLRKWRNTVSDDPPRRHRAQEAALLDQLMQQAWHETSGGRLSPPAPW